MATPGGGKKWWPETVRSVSQRKAAYGWFKPLRAISTPSRWPRVVSCRLARDHYVGVLEDAHVRLPGVEVLILCEVHAIEKHGSGRDRVASPAEDPVPFGGPVAAVGGGLPEDLGRARGVPGEVDLKLAGLAVASSWKGRVPVSVAVGLLVESLSRRGENPTTSPEAKRVPLHSS